LIHLCISKREDYLTHGYTFLKASDESNQTARISQHKFSLIGWLTVCSRRECPNDVTNLFMIDKQIKLENYSCSKQLD